MNARDLVAEVRAGLGDVERRIREHPWLAALEAGRVPRDQLAAFAGEQREIIASDLRSFETLLARTTGRPEAAWVEGMVAGERAALRALEPFAAAVFAPPDHEPIAQCQAYPSFVARLCRDASAAEVAGAFLVNLEAWGGNCARMRDALQKAYGLHEEAILFFRLFAEPPTGFDDRTLDVIEAGLGEGTDPKGIARAARLLQAFELMYWDGLPR